MTRALQRQPWNDFETKRLSEPPDFVKQNFASPNGMDAEHLSSFREARIKFSSELSDQLRELSELKLGIAGKLRNRPGTYSPRRFAAIDGIMSMMRSEAMLELLLIIQGPRRPDGWDRPWSGTSGPISRGAKADAPSFIFDLPVDEAKFFVEANRAKIEPHAMDLVDLARVMRSRRALRRKPRPHSQANELTRLGTREYALRSRMPDWEVLARQQGLVLDDRSTPPSERRDEQ